MDFAVGLWLNCFGPTRIIYFFDFLDYFTTVNENL